MGAPAPRGFWRWLEELYADPRRRAALLRWFWLASLAFTAFGVAVILLILTGRRP